MKVLVHGLSARRGGVESFLLAYCTRIMDLHNDVNFDFVLYGNEHPTYLNQLQPYGSSIFHVPDRLHNPIANVRQLRTLLVNGKYDLVWFNACSLSDVTLLALAKKFDVPCVVHSHNSAPMGNCVNSLLHSMHKQWISRFANIGIGCSDYALDFMFPTHFIESGCCAVIPNAVDCIRFAFSPQDRTELREQLGLSNSFVLGHIGRFADQKNHRFLIDVMKEVLRREKRARLLLLGSGELEGEVKRKVEELGIADCVLFVGSVPDAYRYYSAMDCFVFPSLYEGMPLALLEAQVSGLPCIASNAISPMSFVMDSAKELPLSSGPSVWAEAIIETVGQYVDRDYAAGEMADRGFGLSESSERVYSIFRQALQ